VDRRRLRSPKLTASASPANIPEYTVAIGRKGGQIGGKRRLKTAPKTERSKVAARAAKAPLEKSSAIASLIASSLSFFFFFDSGFDSTLPGLAEPFRFASCRQHTKLRLPHPPRFSAGGRH